MNTFLTLLQDSLREVEHVQSIDLFEKFQYEEINLPIINLSNVEDDIQVSADNSWKHSLSVKISVISNNTQDCFRILQDCLKVISLIPKDTYIIEVTNISEENQTLESNFIRLSITLKVSYYTRGYEL